MKWYLHIYVISHIRKLSDKEMILLNCGSGRRLLRVPLDYKEIQPVHTKGNQSWILIGSTDAEAENSKLWPFDVKNFLIVKDPDARKDWKQEEKMTEERMVE